jgi:hypothetical protein
MTSLDSDSSSSITAQVPKLDEDNFSVWKRRMTAALKYKNKWKYVDGTAEKPHMDTDATDKVKAAKEYKKEMDEYVQADSATAAFIELHISNAQLNHVTSCKTAAETWKALCDAHEKRGMNTALQYMFTMLSSKLAPGGDVRAHINMLSDTKTDWKPQDLGSKWMISSLVVYSCSH